MGTLNKIILIGRVGFLSLKDRVTANGVRNRILELSVVTSRFTKNKDNQYTEKATWHNVSVYNDTLIDYLLKSVEKGDEVFVEGYMDVSVDKENNRKYWRVIVGYGGNISVFNKGKRNKDEASDSVEEDKFYKGKRNGSNYSDSTEASERDGDFAEDDEIPF